jgi:Co/Zn/Cd efflux system component
MVATNGVITAAIELFGSHHSDSLGLLSDAYHLLADLAPTFVGWLAFARSSHRLELWTTRINIILLCVVGFAIGHEAWGRYMHPVVVDRSMLYFALFGCVGNGLQAYVGHNLLHVHEHAHTGFSQVMHLSIDFLASLAVLAGAVALWVTHASHWDLQASLGVMVMSFLAAGVTFVMLRSDRHAHHHAH